MYSVLIGHPVNHSVSSVLFKYLNNITLKKDYRHILVNVDNRKALKEEYDLLFSDHNCLGGNITLPYKLESLHYVKVDKKGKEIGAINTFYRRNKEFIGTNTDWIGIYSSLLKIKNINKKDVLILGTSGAARAAICAAKKTAHKVIVAFRNLEDGSVSEATASLLKDSHQKDITMVPYSLVKDILKKVDVIINATSVGMIGFDRLIPEIYFNIPICKQTKHYIEAVFNPLQTCMLQQFQKKGYVTVDGLWMMIYQGIKAFSLWNKCDGLSINNDQLKKIHSVLQREIEKNG